MMISSIRMLLSLLFLLLISSSISNAKLKSGPNDEASKKAAAEIVEKARRVGQEFEISRVFHLPQCLDDDTIIGTTGLTRIELDRIRSNTNKILKGNFRTAAAGVGFYETVADEEVSDLDGKQRPFEGNIIVETNPWESNNLASMTAALLIQDVLGYPTFLWEIPLTGPLNPYSRAGFGWTHLNVENWESDDVEFFKVFVQEKQLTKLVDTQSYSARNGIYFPTWMMKEKKNKNRIITSWQSLLDPEVYEQYYAFDPDRYNRDPKARQAIVDTFVCKDTYCPKGYFIPPQCEKEPTKCREYLAADPAFAVGVTEQMFTNLELPFVIVYLGVNELWIEASKRIQNREPVLFFSWLPTPIVSQFDVTRVMLPEAVPECYQNRTRGVVGPIDCDYGFDLLRSIAWAKLERHAPSILEFGSRFSIPALAMQDIVKRFITYDPRWMYRSDNQEIVYNAVCGWLQTNAETWKLWVPLPKEAERQEPGTWIRALIFAVAAVCLLVFIGVILLVFIYRKKTIIRFSDPVFLYIMVFGTILATIGVILNVVPTPPETYSCQIVVWFISIGFTLFFATLFAKTLRMVWIFFQADNLKGTTRRFIFNKKHLFYILALFLVVDAIILGIWTGIDTLEPREVIDGDNELQFYVLCRSSHDDAFIITLAVVKCIVVGVAAVMAYLARRLPNLLNESYYIFLTVYNVVFFTAIILPVSAILSDDPEASMIVRCLGILFCSVTSVLLLLVPKFYIIYTRQHGASSQDNILEGLSSTPDVSRKDLTVTHTNSG